MGKTLIAEAALFEALHTGQQAYYTTPLIALTEQKFREMQDRAVAWGFQATDVGLVTGNRRENPSAPVLVVVAEILLNRLLHGEFDFERHLGRGDGRVPQLQRSGTRHRLGADPGPAAAARAPALALGHGGQRHGLHPLAAAEPPADAGTGPRRRAPRAAELPLDRRHAADRAARRDGPGRRRDRG